MKRRLKQRLMKKVLQAGRSHRLWNAARSQLVVQAARAFHRTTASRAPFSEAIKRVAAAFGRLDDEVDRSGRHRACKAELP